MNDDYLITTKAEVPNYNTTIIWTPIFEWYVVGCGSKNRHQNDTYFKEIGLHARDLITILGAIVNVIWGGAL
jgi:hypothetical protein